MKIIRPSLILPVGIALWLGLASSNPVFGQTSFLESLDRRVSAQMAKDKIPGVALAIIRDHKVVTERFYGFADPRSKTPVTATSGFGVASVSKMFTAWGVLKLVEEGKIDLDEPVHKVLKRWTLPTSRFDENKITLRHLLSHTASFGMSGKWHYPVNRPIPTLLESVSGKARSPLRLRLVQSPGSGFKYSGANYAVLQLVIEEVTGRPFADYQRDTILRPLGLSHTDYEFTEEIASRLVTSHNPGRRRIVHHLAITHAAGNIHTTLRDLEAFMATWFEGPNGEPPGRGLLTPETIQLLRTPAPATGGGYGLGYQVKPALPGMTVVGSSGGTRGWVCEVYSIAETGDGLIVLTSSTSGGGVCDVVHAPWIGWVFNRSLDARKKTPPALDEFTRTLLGPWRGKIEGAGDGTRIIPFRLTFKTDREGRVGGTYRADHWEKEKPLEVMELAAGTFAARIVGNPGSYFEASKVGSDRISGRYYENGTMTFWIERLK